MLIEFLWMLATLAFWYAVFPFGFCLGVLLLGQLFKCDCDDHKHW